LLNISNDDFIRTTEERHKRAAQAIWQRVADRGYLYKAPYEGWYCTVDELFVPETQLLEGRRCPTCGNPVERLAEESYFFRLSQFTERLLAHYRANPDFVSPEIRRNEMISFVSAGLRDLSVSRTSFKWGIPVPGDPAHVMYVWFDALTNYITAAGFPDDETRFNRYWPADIHLMGKEIVRQHTVYWPAFLMAADLPLPRLVADERSQDVEVPWQRRAPARIRGAVRRGRAALFRDARDGARPGRELHGRGVSHAVQLRSRQRSRQRGQPGDDDDPAVLRGTDPGTAEGSR
jgi:methionyl-tRNA synthetase